MEHTFLTQIDIQKVRHLCNIKIPLSREERKDVSTTLDIYTDVTKELVRREFDDFEETMNENLKSAEAEK